MNRNERIIHNIGVFVLGIFMGVVMAIGVYVGIFCREEPKQERENIRIMDRQSTMTTNVKAW